MQILVGVKIPLKNEKEKLINLFVVYRQKHSEDFGGLGETGRFVFTSPIYHDVKKIYMYTVGVANEFRN